jgi:hypothetical protein
LIHFDLSLSEELNLSHRRLINMASNANIVINRSIKIVTNTGKLQVTKAFAELNLSKSALKYAEKNDTHYSWDWGTTSYIVVFELPNFFNTIVFGEILRFLVNYCKPYMVENDLNDSVIYHKFLENSKKVTK